MKDINLPTNIKKGKWQEEKGGEYQKEIKLDAVYGPINSRRRGLSLGINPIQGGFACNWSCLYCQYGAQSLDEVIKAGRIRFSTLDEIRKGLERKLTSNEHYDSITICGPTEPTISPYFNDIVDLAVEMRDRYRPDIETSLFTNATKLRDKNVYPLDFVDMKLDAGNEETFIRFNRPRGVSFGDLINELKWANVRRRVIQTAVVGGKDGNLGQKNLEDYITRIDEIKPDEIHLYPLLYKPFPQFDLQPISRESLESLARHIGSSTSTKVSTFFDPVKMGEEFRY